MNTNLGNIPIDEIRALADERERYEGWIAALEGRRAQTPPHVYERVNTDYAGRLGRVLDRLGEHVPGLRDGEAALTQREASLVRALDERRDELAEIELRTAVGEYPSDEGERLRSQKHGEVGQLESERAELEADLATVRELVVRATPPGGRDADARREGAGDGWGSELQHHQAGVAGFRRVVVGRIVRLAAGRAGRGAL